MKAYIVELSNKSTIQADVDEVEKIMTGIETGNPVQLRQGIFNPSFFVAITPDEDRISIYKKDLLLANKHNDRDRLYEGGNDQKELPKPTLLKDIFNDTPLQISGKK